ncbi:MAG: hypothetical protein AB1Z98_09945 [Nannocystaceae bacterium]
MTKSKPSPTRSRKSGHGVFCLEGDWWDVADSTTIEPALTLLKSNGEFAFDYIHRDVGVVAGRNIDAQFLVGSKYPGR